MKEKTKYKRIRALAKWLNPQSNLVESVVQNEVVLASTRLHREGEPIATGMRPACDAAIEEYVDLIDRQQKHLKELDVCIEAEMKLRPACEGKTEEK